MRVNQFLIKNKHLLITFSLCAIIIGGIISYINYGDEPWETVGGFICGVSFGLFVIFVSVKEVKK